MASGSRGRVDVVAVIDKVDDCVSVWWVNTGVRPQQDFSRLCGAWVYRPGSPDLAENIEALTFGRMTLSTSSGRAALKTLKVSPSRVLNLGATLTAAADQVSLAQRTFSDEQKKRGAGKLKTPRWPEFPDLVDIDNLSRAGAADPLVADPVGRCLTIARWLSRLCSTWEDFESERRARPLLREKFGPERNLPVVTHS